MSPLTELFSFDKITIEDISPGKYAADFVRIGYFYRKTEHLYTLVYARFLLMFSDCIHTSLTKVATIAVL